MKSLRNDSAPHAPALLVAILSLAVSLVACGSVTPDVEEDALPCAIERIVVENCQECHSASPEYGAPMALTRASLFRERSVSSAAHSVGDMVLQRIASDTDPMPPPPRARLEQHQRDALAAWIHSGAPAGESCSVQPPKPVVPTLACDVNVTAQPSEPFVVPPGAADRLVCYGVDLKNAAKRHVVGFAPRVDNAVVLHHASLLLADTPLSTTPQDCPDNTGMAAWRVVYGWAPGAGAMELPADVGFAADAGAQFVVQLHYVNTTDQPQADSSGFGLCSTEKLRSFDADIMAFGTHEISIPAHGQADVRCTVQVPPNGATTKLFSAFPHMHRLGQSMSTRVLAQGGAVDIGSVENWNFDYQSWQQIDHVLTPGEIVETKCAWKNPHSYGVGFGPSTDDEMCYSFVMYYPRIEDPSWHWLLPALYSECGK